MTSLVDEATPLKTDAADESTKHAFEALKLNIRPWHRGTIDSFWADYLNQTFVRPLWIVSLFLADEKRSEKATITVVDVACGTGEFVKRLQVIMQQPSGKTTSQAKSSTSTTVLNHALKCCNRRSSRV
jgi:hypothetical protein